MTTTATAPVSKDQAILNDTEQKRQDLYDKVVSGEMDPKVASAAAKLLDGRDKQVISQQRIEADKQISSNTTEVAKQIIAEMRKLNGNSDPKKADVPAPVVHTIPDDPAPGQVVVAGSKTVGIANEKYDEFQDRMEKGDEFVQKVVPQLKPVEPVPASK